MHGFFLCPAQESNPRHPARRRAKEVCYALAIHADPVSRGYFLLNLFGTQLTLYRDRYVTPPIRNSVIIFGRESETCLV